MFGRMVALAQKRRSEVLTPEILARIMISRPLGPLQMVMHTGVAMFAIAFVWLNHTCLTAKVIAKAVFDLIGTVVFAPLVSIYLAFDLTTVLFWVWWKIVSKEGGK